MKKELVLAYRMLKQTIAYDLGQIKVYVTDTCGDEIIMYSVNNCETFNHCQFAVMLDQIGCSNYVAYNHKLSRLEMHIY